MGLQERLSQKCFRWVHQHNLVYNTCWEDPRLDHQALRLGSEDDVLVITSAGCNALDYALAGPRSVHAVDVNPLQNALVELKLAGIRALSFEQFYELFGRGRTTQWDALYARHLRPQLSAEARKVWDKRGHYFRGKGRRKSFYFRGSSGLFAFLVNGYINRVARIRRDVNELLASRSLEEQRQLYYGRNLDQQLWKPIVTWCLRRDTTLSMLGVPRSQRLQIDHGYPGGIVQFVKDRVETVFGKLPLQDNYFWRVYLTGEYAPECCPAYLERESFQRLQAGLVDRIHVHTDSVLGFLQQHPGTISRYVLLDHMDWLYSHYPDVLQEEWQAIVDKAAPGTRLIWRSAGLSVDFVDPIVVHRGDQQVRMGELLQYDGELAARLHPLDRVNTYGSFYIAELMAA